MKVLASLFSALLLCAGMADASVAKASTKASKTQSKAPTEVELLYNLPQEQAAQLQKIVDRFNSQSADTKLVLARRSWRDGPIPVLLFLSGEEQSQFLESKSRYKPLWQGMREAGYPLRDGRAPGQMSTSYLSPTGQLLALPALGTPVLFYNKSAFRAVGLNPDQPPTTWSDLQDALGRLRNGGYVCPYASSDMRWIHVENIDAWHDNNFANNEKLLSINDMLMIKHTAMMLTWVQSSYLHMFDQAEVAGKQFASGQCAVLTSNSSLSPSLQREAGFEVGIAPLPYHQGFPGAPRHTLADGAGLWLGAGHQKSEYQAAARFVNFLLTSGQGEWQQQMGYLPLGNSGFPNLSLTASAVSPLHNKVALETLTYKPVTGQSKATRLAQRPEIKDIVDRELRNVWTAQKTTKTALDDAVLQSRALAPGK